MSRPEPVYYNKIIVFDELNPSHPSPLDSFLHARTTQTRTSHHIPCQWSNLPTDHNVHEQTTLVASIVWIHVLNINQSINDFDSLSSLMKTPQPALLLIASTMRWAYIHSFKSIKYLIHFTSHFMYLTDLSAKIFADIQFRLQLHRHDILRRRPHPSDKVKSHVKTHFNNYMSKNNFDTNNPNNIEFITNKFSNIICSNINEWSTHFCDHTKIGIIS
jgi:hypothetical protein